MPFKHTEATKEKAHYYYLNGESFTFIRQSLKEEFGISIAKSTLSSWKKRYQWDQSKMDDVSAYSFPTDYPRGKIQIRKGKLQTSKKEWDASNFAKYVSTLRDEYKMEIEEIAKDLQLSVKEVNEYLKDVSENDE